MIVYLVSSVSILPYLSLVVFLCWDLNIWDLDDCRPKCCLLDLSSLGGYFPPWFLLPLLILGNYDGCVLPGRKLSVDMRKMKWGMSFYMNFSLLS